jgi:hypothetical protein
VLANHRPKAVIAKPAQAECEANFFELLPLLLAKSELADAKPLAMLSY